MLPVFHLSSILLFRTIDSSKGIRMDRGISLVELMISLTISTILILTLYTMYSLFSKGYIDSRDSWYCMQSLRCALVQIDADLRQCACLMPQDLKVAAMKNSLFISGAPVTSSYSGIALHGKLSPPYFSVVRSLEGNRIILDSVDIDQNNVPDYWADLGNITDSGPYVISHGYSRGSPEIALTSLPKIKVGDRSVPSIHYELKEDGLYRNSQLLAEAIRAFDVSRSGDIVTISLTAGHNSEKKHISYAYELK